MRCKLVTQYEFNFKACNIDREIKNVFSHGKPQHSLAKMYWLKIRPVSCRLATSRSFNSQETAGSGGHARALKQNGGRFELIKRKRTNRNRAVFMTRFYLIFPVSHQVKDVYRHKEQTRDYGSSSKRASLGFLEYRNLFRVIHTPKQTKNDRKGINEN